MNKLELIQELKNLKLIAHRLGYKMTEYPENSLMVLESIFEDEEMLESCAGFEFDICFTKDHIPVVIHDKYIDDISDTAGLVKSYTLDELKSLNFGFRKSLNGDNALTFKIITLEEILAFFCSHSDLLKDKIIKFETKDAYTSRKNFENLAAIIRKFPILFNNLIHLSFWPQNLRALKKIQKENNQDPTKTDLLCDYKIIVFISRFMGFLDNISYRIKTTDFPRPQNSNSHRVNFKIIADIFFMKFSNAISAKTLNYSIKRFNEVGLYVLNDIGEINVQE